MLVFCVPHEHMYACVKPLKLLDCVDPGAHAISLKGIRWRNGTAALFRDPNSISQILGWR